MIKPLLLRIMYLTLWADFRITLHLMKSNCWVPLPKKHATQKFITKPQSNSMS